MGHGDFMSTDTDDRVNSTLLVFVGSCIVIFFSYSNGSSLAPWTPEHMRIGEWETLSATRQSFLQSSFRLTPALGDFEGIS